MKIMVFFVSASDGGALSILKDFYYDVRFYNDKNIKWYFVVSTPYLEETENIKILRFPWIKKSWIHRLYFDYFIAPNLIRKYNIDKVFSLQNTLIPNTKVLQILYVHNSLPFYEHKFTIKENILFWIYQNVIGKKILKSIKKADKVIVQTNWFKKTCVKKTKINPEKIIVIPPKINIKIRKFFTPTKESLRTFFYPAKAFPYKNHKVIVEAAKKLKNDGIKNFKVIFTLKAKENRYTLKLYKEIKENNLPIKFIGNLSRKKVFELYTKSILIFPSYIETFGLPLLEAKLHKTIILASNLLFSHEILDGYKHAYFFDPFDENSLYILMKKFLFSRIEDVYDFQSDFTRINNKSLIEIIINN